MNNSLWQQELLRAPSAEDVLSTVRDYLVLWTPLELSQLPEPCDPGAFLEPHDVSDYAAALLAHEGEGKRRPGARETLTAFFTIAARRLAELAAREMTGDVEEEAAEAA